MIKHCFGFRFLEPVNNELGNNDKLSRKSCSARGHRIRLIFLGQKAASRCEVFPTFREVIPSPSEGCAGGSIACNQHTLKMGTE